jgi:hypothetical protein
MKSLSTITLTLLTLLACRPQPNALAPQPWPAADIVVATDSSGRYRSIPEAIAHARDGDVILVKPGVYTEPVRIAERRGITLLGTDPATTIIDGADRYAAVEIRTDSNRIIGLCLRGADSHGAWVRDGHQVFSRCLVCDNGECGIYLSAMAGNASALIDHCTIADNGATGINAARDSAATTITNSIIAFNPRGIATDEPNGLMSIHHNTLWSTALDYDRALPGATNMIADPHFRSRDVSDYRLAPDSPCLNAAADGTNQGCF